MKTCPFCQEPVHDAAIKCRHCASSLTDTAGARPAAANVAPATADRIVFVVSREWVRLAKSVAIAIAVLVVIGAVIYLYGFHAGALPATQTQVVYILDGDLVRFVKFAASVFAIFFTVGIFVWGFDVKRAAQEVKDSRDETRKALEDVRQIRADVGKAKGEVESDRQASAARLQEMLAAREAVQKTVSDLEVKQKKIQELLESSQQAESNIKRFEAQISSRPDPRETAVSHGSHSGKSFSPPQLARLYDFPPHLDGAGQTIGIIALGGGYKESDLDAYFKGLDLARPKVSWVSVQRAKNRPGVDGADGMVILNIEVAGAVAPGANIVVYFAPNTDDGFVGAIKAAANDRKNQPSVLMIAWGGAEDSWAVQAVSRMNEALRQATLGGITIVCSSGDGGVDAGLGDGHRHVLFPASSPWVLACGGTRLKLSRGKIVDELVWNDTADSGAATGGGTSKLFPVPDWQRGVDIPPTEAGQPGRGIPDVAAHASAINGYLMRLHGQDIVLGGTGASAALWAGLVALLNQGLGRNVGYLNRLLYDKLGPANILRDITQGRNGRADDAATHARPGWDTCTGWGSPDGQKLLDALRTEMAAPH